MLTCVRDTQTNFCEMVYTMIGLISASYIFILQCPIPSNDDLLKLTFVQAHSVGPALGGLPGTNIAAAEGFAYSNALQSKATLKWTDGNLDKWLTAPSKFAPGNAMAFAGLGSQKDRADIIAYLKGG